MGFALPASIGASIYGNNTIVISGDGGLQMNIQELEILKRRNLPVKIIVMNNKNLGMVRSFQELYFENRCASTVIDYTAPDFAKIADAYGIDAVEINANDFSFDKIKKYMNTNSPALINIILPENSSVEPRLEFGNSIENSSPLLEANELKELLE